MSDELTDTQVEEPEPEAPAPDDPLATVTAERDAYLDLAQRVQADFENYRKRAAREQERLVAHAHERLVRELLPSSTTWSGRSRPPSGTRRRSSSRA